MLWQVSFIEPTRPNVLMETQFSGLVINHNEHTLPRILRIEVKFQSYIYKTSFKHTYMFLRRNPLNMTITLKNSVAVSNSCF